MIVKEAIYSLDFKLRSYFPSSRGTNAGRTLIRGGGGVVGRSGGMSAGAMSGGSSVGGDDGGGTSAGGGTLIGTMKSGISIARRD